MNFFRFIEERQSYYQEIKEAADEAYCYQTLSAKIEPTIVKKQYGIGGKVMLRGPLCPCFLEDYVVGNVHRGRLCAIAKNPDYTYYFDDWGRLVKVDKHTEVGICSEYIISKGNISYGFHFSGQERWKDGVYAVILEDGHIGATVYHPVIGDYSHSVLDDVWTFEYADGRPIFVAQCYVKELPDLIHSEFSGPCRGYRLEFDEKDQIVRYYTSNLLYPERDEPRQGRSFDLARPIPPKVWRQTYGLI